MRKLHRLWQYPTFLVFCFLAIVSLPIAAGMTWVAVRVGHEIVSTQMYDQEEV